MIFLEGGYLIFIQIFIWIQMLNICFVFSQDIIAAYLGGPTIDGETMNETTYSSRNIYRKSFTNL